MASFEKPIINLKINAIYRSNHKEAPLYFDIRSAWDINIYEIAKVLNDREIKFLAIKTLKKDIKISFLDERILVIESGEFLSAKKRDYINSFSDKNYALFGLCVSELNLANSTIARVFLSKNSKDFIKVYKDNDEIFERQFDKLCKSHYSEVESIEEQKQILYKNIILFKDKLWQLFYKEIISHFNYLSLCIGENLNFVEDILANIE